MKRISKAEEALKKQVREVQYQMDVTQQAINDGRVRLEAQREIKMALETEMYNLERARRNASEKAKTAP